MIREVDFMNIDKFTRKSKEAIMELEKTALDFGNQEIDEEHLLYVLITQEDSLIAKLLEKMGIDTASFTSAVENAIDSRVKVSGGTQYWSADLNKVLLKSPDEARSMGDEYTSVEHLLLSMLKYPNKAVKGLFSRFGITRDSFLSALAACGASGVAGGSMLLIPMACSLFGISNDIAMEAVAVGFIIGVVQDSVETALNSSGDAIFTVTSEWHDRMKKDLKNSTD